jgi:hypothetical protein
MVTDSDYEEPQPLLTANELYDESRPRVVDLPDLRSRRGAVQYLQLGYVEPKGKNVRAHPQWYEVKTDEVDRYGSSTAESTQIRAHGLTYGPILPAYDDDPAPPGHPHATDEEVKQLCNTSFFNDIHNIYPPIRGVPINLVCPLTGKTAIRDQTIGIFAENIKGQMYSIKFDPEDYNPEPDLTKETNDRRQKIKELVLKYNEDESNGLNIPLIEYTIRPKDTPNQLITRPATHREYFVALLQPAQVNQKFLDVIKRDKDHY